MEQKQYGERIELTDLVNRTWNIRILDEKAELVYIEVREEKYRHLLYLCQEKDDIYLTYCIRLKNKPF